MNLFFAAPISFTPTSTILAPDWFTPIRTCGGPMSIRGGWKTRKRGSFASLFVWRKSNLLRPTEPLRQIDRIPNGHIVRIDLIRPNRKVRQLGLPVNRRERAIHRVVTGTNPHPADAGLIEARVKDLPTAPEIDFEIRVK